VQDNQGGSAMMGVLSGDADATVLQVSTLPFCKRRHGRARDNTDGLAIFESTLGRGEVPD
jgi:hypothetical protein